MKDRAMPDAESRGKPQPSETGGAPGLVRPAPERVAESVIDSLRWSREEGIVVLWKYLATVHACPRRFVSA